MKIISKNKDDTKREVIIDGETKHVHKKNGKWWMSKDGTPTNLIQVKEER